MELALCEDVDLLSFDKPDLDDVSLDLVIGQLISLALAREYSFAIESEYANL